MKTIRINAKSIPTLEELKPKIDAGFRNIEIQLIHKKVAKSEYEEIKEAIVNQYIDVSVVHTPLMKNPNFEIALNHLLLFGIDEILDDTCKVAEYIARIENHRIKVVIHNDCSEEEWIETNLLKEKIGPMIKGIISIYPDVDIVIENSSSSGEKGFKTIKSMSDVAYTVKTLKEIVGNRVFPLIDTCHIMMTWEAWKRYAYEDLTNWDQQFAEATKFQPLGLIHLNNMHDNGRNEDHGVAFDFNNTEDKLKLKKIMDAYNKYASCEITIEVREDDYLAEPKNIITTRDALEKMGYELDIG